MKRFQELLMKDIGWKLLSVAIAAIMWFIVINTTQPVDTRNYNRTITLQNMETLTARGLAIGNEEALKNMKISVKVKAQRTALDRLNQNPEWLQVSVDVSGLTEVANGDSVTLPVDVSIQSSSLEYDIVSRAPKNVELSIETLLVRTFPVQIDMNGESANHRLSEPILSRDTVTVSGPYSVVNRVAEVAGVVNAADIREKEALSVKLTAYDSSGAAVSGVSLSPAEISVSYALQEQKSVPIQVDIVGSPAEGYQVGRISCNPQYAEVLGTKDALEGLVYLPLESIDISGASAPISQSFSLEKHLPEGILLQKDAVDTVTVLVEILEQSGKAFPLDETNLTLTGQEEGMQYQFESTEILLEGETDVLEGLTAAQLKGTVHVNGLPEGTHTVMIHMDLPDGVTAPNPAYLNVTVRAEASAAEPDEIEEE